MPYLDLLESVIASTAPTAEPVTLNDVKDHLGILPEDSTHDRKLETFIIPSARQMVEARLSKTLVTTTWTANYRDFPRSGWWIELPFPPLASVTSVKYYDENGTQQTWSSSEYIVDTSSSPGRVALDPDYTWPSTEVGRISRVEVIYVAGQAASAISEIEKEQVFHWCNILFEDRGGEADRGRSLEIANAMHYATWPGTYS